MVVVIVFQIWRSSIWFCHLRYQKKKKEKEEEEQEGKGKRKGEREGKEGGEEERKKRRKASKKDKVSRQIVSLVPSFPTEVMCFFWDHTDKGKYTSAKCFI